MCSYKDMEKLLIPFARRLASLCIILCMVGASACSQSRSLTEANSPGPAKKLRVKVGEIKEIKLSGRGDNQAQLIGNSDNTEVVDVSRQQLTPAIDTLKKTNPEPVIFQIKGVTTGTAKVMFYEKMAGETGNGQLRKTYQVQVVNK